MFIGFNLVIIVLIIELFIYWSGPLTVVAAFQKSMMGLLPTGSAVCKGRTTWVQNRLKDMRLFVSVTGVAARS